VERQTGVHVYLHVGAAKNWILQYSLPRAQEAASAGSFSRPECHRGPTTSTRPSIDADSNTDAIMVHGFVNTAEDLSNWLSSFPRN